jgi:hypothetical protein
MLPALFQQLAERFMEFGIMLMVPRTSMDGVTKNLITHIPGT